MGISECGASHRRGQNPAQYERHKKPKQGNCWENRQDPLIPSLHCLTPNMWISRQFRRLSRVLASKSDFLSFLRNRRRTYGSSFLASMEVIGGNRVRLCLAALKGVHIPRK